MGMLSLAAEKQNRDFNVHKRNRSIRWPVIIVAAISCATPSGAPMAAPQDNKPYDERLLRLSEILGAVHYLRELCGANEGQFWRERMEDLMASEGTSALRKAKLTRSFNQGYRSYSRTYNSCTASAQSAVSKFLAEGVEITETLVKSRL